MGSGDTPFSRRFLARRTVGRVASTGTALSSSHLSIVSVAYESRAVLPNFVRAAVSAAPDAEIVIVDNGSTDGGPDLVASIPQVTVLAQEANVGFGRACNAGAAHARGDVLVFANPDLWLTQCEVRESQVKAPLGLGAGWLIGPAESRRAAIYPDPGSVGSVYNELFARLAPREIASARWPFGRKEGYVSGALCVALASEFRSLGGFDSRFFLYHEDRDLGRRYRAAGFPFVELKTVSGSHLHGSSSRKVSAAAGQAWSIVSLVEYTAIWDGMPAARRTARRLVQGLRGAARCLSWAAGTGPLLERRRRKAAEYDELIERVENFPAYLPEGITGFYPEAREALNAS